MVGAVEDVPEAQPDEPERGLVPARIETDEARIALELERAHRAAGGQEPERGDHAQAETAERGMDREAGALGTDRILEEHVEHRLAPVDLGVVGQGRARDVLQRLLVASEAAVGGQRHAHGDDARGGQALVLLVELDRAGDPEVGGVPQ